jgi:hypothetical protein
MYVDACEKSLQSLAQSVEGGEEREEIMKYFMNNASLIQF